MRAFAAVWIFGLALAGGTFLYFRKIATDQTETGVVHLGLRKLVPKLRRGQMLYFMTDANEGMRLMHARLELAPCNLFLAKSGETPDTMLIIGKACPKSFARQQYRELAATRSGDMDFKIFTRLQ
jgi:hypothetical protein